MSRGYFYKIDQTGHRRHVLTYRNAHSGPEVIWAAAGLALGHPRATSRQLFAELAKGTLPPWAMVAVATTNTNIWVSKEHLLLVANAFAEVTKRTAPEEPSPPPSLLWSIPDPKDWETNVLPKLEGFLREFAQDPTVLGVYFYWNSVCGDPAERQVEAGSDFGPGFCDPPVNLECDVWQVECDFTSPESRRLHEIGELFEVYPELTK